MLLSLHHGHLPSVASSLQLDEGESAACRRFCLCEQSWSCLPGRVGVDGECELLLIPVQNGTTREGGISWSLRPMLLAGRWAATGGRELVVGVPE